MSRRSALKLPELSLSLSLPPVFPLCWPLFEAGYPSWPCRRPSFTLDVCSIIRPRGRERVGKLERGGGGGSGRKIEKDIYYPSARRVLSRRNLEKKDDLERGSAMICAGGEGIHEVGTACDRRKNARDRNKGVSETRRGSCVCIKEGEGGEEETAQTDVCYWNFNSVNER